MPFVTTRGGHALHVRVLGRGAPCVLLHGFASDSRSWLPFVLPLLHRRRFIIPDLRGFGRSHEVPLEGDCPLTQFATDLEDVLSAMNVHSAALVGISMGAFTALQTFRMFGGARFDRYMHIDQGPSIKNRPDYPFGLLGAAQAEFFPQVAQLLEKMLGEFAEAHYDELPRELREEFWRLLGEFSSAAFTPPLLRQLLLRAARNEALMRRVLPIKRVQAYATIVRAYLERDYDLRDAFGAIAVPMTVLIGGASRMYPPEGQRTIRELAPHARVREVANVGHMLPYEAPREFMRELRTFLA
jgi:non-heme chloroperoxidase